MSVWYDQGVPKYDYVGWKYYYDHWYYGSSKNILQIGWEKINGKWYAITSLSNLQVCCRILKSSDKYSNIGIAVFARKIEDNYYIYHFVQLFS